MSSAPVINTKLRNSPRIFVKIRNGPYMGYSGVRGQLNNEKNQISKISQYQTPFKEALVSHNGGKKVFIEDLLDSKCSPTAAEWKVPFRMASLWAWLEQESSTLSPPQASLDRKESGLHLYTTSKCRLEQESMSVFSISEINADQANADRSMSQCKHYFSAN